MKAHRTDLVSFAFGLLFLGLSAWWLLAQILGLAVPPVGWFLAGALLLIGVLGLVGALRAARPARPTPPDGNVPAPETVAPTSGQPVPETAAWDVDRSAAGREPTGWGADRPTSGGAPTGSDAERPTGEVAGWDVGHREWDVSAPMSGRPATGTVTGGAEPEEADEWPAQAVTDRLDEAVEDQPDTWPAPAEEPPARPPAGEDRRHG